MYEEFYLTIRCFVFISRWAKNKSGDKHQKCRTVTPRGNRSKCTRYLNIKSLSDHVMSFPAHSGNDGKPPITDENCLSLGMRHCVI